MSPHIKPYLFLPLKKIYILHLSSPQQSIPCVVAKMGLVASFMGGGLPTAQLLNLVMKTLYDSFVRKEISSFEEFHVAILDIFNTFNSALPGKHYDAPSYEEVKTFYEKWQGIPEEDKKKMFVEFMMDKISVSKLDDSTLIAGLVTPPVAMAAKKAGENVPQLKIIKAVPDVLFVPSATVVALISVKVSRKLFYRRIVHPDQPSTST